MNIMKKWMLYLMLIFAFGAVDMHAQRAFIEQSLVRAMDDAGPNEMIPVLLMLESAVDVVALKAQFEQNNTPVSMRAQLVMSALKQKAAETQPAVVDAITESGLQYEQVQTFWISNSIAFHGEPALISLIADLPNVAQMTLNEAMFSTITPEKVRSDVAKSEGGIEPGLAVIGAPEMWALGYTGLGRIAMTFDTGVWPDHPALTNRFLPNRMPIASTWFGYDSDLPSDKSSSHGTHVSGIMLGLDTATADTIGVAPRAYFIATDPIVSNIAFVKPLTDLMLGYEWSLNPDGDESTSDDIPDVINNSWGRSNDVEDQDWDICPDFVIPVLNAVEAAGIANVFSAGNEGPDPESISVPHNINTGLVNSFTVAAVNGIGLGPSWNVANFSSRGPSLCGGEGSLLIKPEVSAPGVNVRSSVDSDGYDLFSGTSMAAPHVSGAILLLKEAFPYLSGEELLLALYYTAIDQGEPGEDNTYGMGVINVKNAYDYLAETNEPVPPASSEFDLEILSILTPNRSIDCESEALGYLPVISVKNNGSVSAEGIEIQYGINGTIAPLYSDATFTLASGETTEIELPFISTLELGSQELHVKIIPSEDEYDKLNNNMVHRWKKLPIHFVDSGNFTEDFESGINSDVWTIVNPDGNITWDTANVIQSNGEMGYAAWMGFFDYSPIASQKDRLITPWIKTTWIDVWYLNPNVTFDLYYRKRTSNAFTQDTLVVLAHVPCYLSDEPLEIFRKGGTELYTNPNLMSNAFPENEEDWVEVNLEIDLVQLLGSGGGEFYLEFQGINRRSNNLLIDNINVSWPETINTTEPPAMEVGIFPNPTRDAVAISWDGNHPNATLRMHDVQGRIVGEISQIANGEMVALPELSRGVYLAAVSFEDGYTKVLKLVIQ
jgi:bacillopeptidase F